MKLRSISLTLWLATSSWATFSEASDSPKDAEGETPVRYVVCRVADDRGCVVVARFQDLWWCEQFREINAMLCDRRSYPGEIRCRAAPPFLGVGYCRE
jgi:hypothetical protein